MTPQALFVTLLLFPLVWGWAVCWVIAIGNSLLGPGND